MDKGQRLRIWRNATQFRDFMIKEDKGIPLPILREWVQASANVWLRLGIMGEV